jgi:hypothetical protein
LGFKLGKTLNAESVGQSLLRKSGELFQSSPKLDDVMSQGCNNPVLEIANAFGVSSSQQLAATGL